jgi:L-fuconolactonase
LVIDAHHHFWNYNPGEYGWISDEMSGLRRNYAAEDLKTEIARAGVDGVVSVQARQLLAETRWLLQLSDTNDFIRGVVGWVPLVGRNVASYLERFSKNKKCRAVRHVVQDEPDEDFILRDDFNRGVAELKRFGLRYDLLIFERHLPQAIQFVDRHPQQVFVLDHIAKPRIRDGILEPWRRNLRELARRPNVYCKLSGVVTETDWKTWTPEIIRPYVDAALDAFGPQRLMFGSDWPVCLVACSYKRWVDVIRDFASDLSPAEQARILGGTAVEAYNLEEPT